MPRVYKYSEINPNSGETFESRKYALENRIKKITNAKILKQKSKNVMSHEIDDDGFFKDSDFERKSFGI